MYTMEQRYELITKRCAEARSADPLGLAVELMRCPEIRFHGPEHHYLTAAVLCAVWCQALREEVLPHLEHLAARCKLIPPGVCGYYGVCGDTMAAGAVLSELRSVTYLSGNDWKLLNDFTAKVQQSIADSCEHGPRCCKRTTFAAVIAAAEAAQKQFGLNTCLPADFACPFHSKNAQCIGKACTFFTKK